MSFRPRLGLFRELTFYVDRYACIGDASTALPHHPLARPQLLIEFHGGACVVDYELEGVTHVLVREEEAESVDELRRMRRKLPQGQKFHMVTEEWVEKCLEVGEIVEERGYEPVQ